MTDSFPAFCEERGLERGLSDRRRGREVRNESENTTPKVAPASALDGIWERHHTILSPIRFRPRKHGAERLLGRGEGANRVLDDGLGLSLSGGSVAFLRD